MPQIRLTRDITSFEVDVESLTEESLHERYLRLMREFNDQADDFETPQTAVVIDE